MNPVPAEVHPADTNRAAPVQETARVVQARPRPFQLSFTTFDQASQGSIVGDRGGADIRQARRLGFDEIALQTGNIDSAGGGEGP